MVDFSFNWFVMTCEVEGLDYNNILVKLELDRARDYAYEMKWWETQANQLKYKPTIEGHWLYSPEVKENARRSYMKNVEKMNEERIKHMITALEMAEIANGMEKGFLDYAETIYSKGGLEPPKF